MEEYLTSEEVAAILKIKPLTVREMFRTNRLRGFKIGKEWRTTRIMLDEDLDAMRRVEVTAPQSKPPRKKQTKLSTAPVQETPPPEPEIEPVPEKPKRRRKEKTDNNSAPDSEQQLLF